MYEAWVSFWTKEIETEKHSGEFIQLVMRSSEEDRASSDKLDVKDWIADLTASISKEDKTE